MCNGILLSFEKGKPVLTHVATEINPRGLMLGKISKTTSTYLVYKTLEDVNLV